MLSKVQQLRPFPTGVVYINRHYMPNGSLLVEPIRQDFQAIRALGFDVGPAAWPAGPSRGGGQWPSDLEPVDRIARAGRSR
jgi:hypothetical protein